MPHDPELARSSHPATIPLLLLIGLPGSGKSTYAATLAQAGPRSIISTDAIRAQLFGDAAIQADWWRVWRQVGSQFRQTVRQMSIAPALPAIYDATNVVRKQRRQAIALARDAGFTHITGVWLNLPLEACLERNQRRDRQVPAAVICKMNRQLLGAPPAVADGFDALQVLAEVPPVLVTG